MTDPCVQPGCDRAAYDHPRAEGLCIEHWEERDARGERPRLWVPPSGEIEIDGLRVPRAEFERIRANRLVWRLADRAAVEEIEMAEIASTLDRWLTGDTVIDIEAETPIWGPASCPWTAAGQQTILAGPDSVGKTTLCCHYAKVRLRLPGWGDELLGDPVEKLPWDQSVLYLACDRPVQIMQNFRRGLTEESRDVLRERMHVWPGPPPLDLQTSAGRQWLLRKVEQVNAGLVLIDSRKDVGDVQEPKEVSRLNLLLKQLDADGVEVVVPAHTIQSTDGPNIPPDLTHVKGQREVYSGTGSVLMIKGRPGADEVVLHQVKPIREHHPKVRVRYDKATGRAVLGDPIATLKPPTEVTVNLSGYDGDETEAEVLARLKEAAEDGLMSADLTGSGEWGKIRRAARNRLEAQGRVVSRTDGKGKRWWAAEFAPD